jgi:hypothetical protein
MAANSGSPIICNGGHDDFHSFHCSFQNRVYNKTKPGQQMDYVNDDWCINQDKGGTRHVGSRF